MLFLEIFLMIGLAGILLIIAFFHILATSNNPAIRDIAQTDAMMSLHPIFVVIETILGLTILYIFKQMIS